MATSGQDALTRVESSEVDLILLDIIMPQMDGFQVCERLKSSEKHRTIPIIFVTARDDERDEARGLQLGAVDFLTKPVNAPVVRARVNTHLVLKFAQETLLKQNQDLREMAQLREDVDQIIRHDLISPLNAIIGFSDILQDVLEMDDEQKKMCRAVIDSGYKLLDMINLSQQMYKMEKGKYRLKPLAIDLLSMVEKIINTHGIQLQKKGLDVQLFLNGQRVEPQKKFMVFGEELLCYSLLNNLFKNAIEASPEGEVISLFLVQADLAEISLHNVGSVPTAIRETFFDKFSTSGKPGGTGLGTYSAQLMAETQQGSIHLQTSDEEGTLITVRLQPASE